MCYSLTRPELMDMLAQAEVHLFPPRSGDWGREKGVGTLMTIAAVGAVVLGSSRRRPCGFPLHHLQRLGGVLAAADWAGSAPLLHLVPAAATDVHGGTEVKIDPAELVFGDRMVALMDRTVVLGDRMIVRPAPATLYDASPGRATSRLGAATINSLGNWSLTVKPGPVQQVTSVKAESSSGGTATHPVDTRQQPH